MDVNKKIIKSDNAPIAIGSYSQAIEFGNLIFTSGQIPINPISNNIISDDFEKQIIQVLTNLNNILIDSGSNKNKIIKLTVYLTDLSNFDKLNDAFADFFHSDFPSRSVVEVVRLPKDSKVEIDAISIK